MMYYTFARRDVMRRFIGSYGRERFKFFSAEKKRNKKM